MVNRHSVHKEHLHVTQQIANHFIKSSKINRVEYPVYLSRTKLKRTNRTNSFILEEEQIEQYCRDSGCKVVYPEQLSLKEQIEIFNKYDIFIGFVGSAFHSILFRTSSRKAKCIYLGDESPNTNYMNIDQQMGNESFFIRCIDRDEKNRLKPQINKQVAIAQLSKLGIRPKKRANS